MGNFPLVERDEDVDIKAGTHTGIVICQLRQWVTLHHHRRHRRAFQGGDELSELADLRRGEFSRSKRLGAPRS